MNALLKKEVRLVLHNWVIGILLVLAACLIPRQTAARPLGLVVGAALVLCPLILVLLSLGIFGREISTGMFSVLLSQPISRKKIWWTKATVLLVATVSLWCGWWGAFQIHAAPGLTVEELSFYKNASILFCWVMVAGSLWTVLVFRQMSTAFWITVLIPMMLFLIAIWFSFYTKSALYELLVVTLCAYALLGSVGAYGLFLKVEDRGGLADANDVFQGKLWVPSFLRARRTAQLREARQTLVWKELKLLQGTLVLAGMMGLIHLGVLCFRLWGKGSHVQHESALDLVAYGFWVLWLTFPFLVGASLFSEERRLGVWESQLCLPVNVRSQLIVKTGMGLLFALCLGSAAPVLIESNQLMPDHSYALIPVLKNEAPLIREGELSRATLIIAKAVNALPFDPQPLIFLGIIAAGIFLIASFASSLSRSLLQSMTISAGGLVLGAALMGWLGARAWALPFSVRPFSGSIGCYIVLPGLVATVAWLTGRNARHVWVTARHWRSNILALLAVFVIANCATGMIYHRVWERLTPMEPPHGNAVLRVQDRLQIRRMWRDGLSITTLDGRGWVADLSFQEGTFWDPNFQAITLAHPVEVRPVGNWACVVPCQMEVVGIQKDGSLWVSSKPRFEKSDGPMGAEPLVQFGTDRDWKQAVAVRHGALLLKTDGTLWAWGQKKLGDRDRYRGMFETAPTKVSKDSDWEDLEPIANSSYGFEFFARKTDGRAWGIYAEDSAKKDSIRVDDDFTLERTKAMDAGQRAHVTEVQSGIAASGYFHTELRTNGTIALTDVLRPVGGRGVWEPRATNIVLGGEQTGTWRGLTSDGETMVSLKSDGTLWKWTFPESTAEAPDKAQAQRLGTHSDWVALTRFGSEVISVASDGSLWEWNFEHIFKDYRNPFLAPSVKPRYVGNILKP